MSPQHISQENKIEVVAAVILQNGRLLLTQRSHPPKLAGLWEFPGGKREPGEKPAQSLKRELFEELGIKAQVGPPLFTASYPHNNPPLILQFFKCKIIAGQPKPLECSAIAWVLPHEISNYELPDPDRQFVDWLLRQSTI
ncbi:MAG: (deoxy)nucleoside triphosphate pyrophosphohydrolase [Verrucomicrobia bacterium]|nr:(deoxy)nucleoside triphosphate pyrophosphohydrolase [Verrucomicrobiota bacterium]